MVAVVVAATVVALVVALAPALVLMPRFVQSLKVPLSLILGGFN